MKKGIMLLVFFFLLTGLSAQTFTMGKDCRKQNSNGISLLKDKNYQQAMDVFDAMEKSCATKDAKEAVAAGKAEAYNGLGQYNEAIDASNNALKISKNKSLSGLFQKAVAQSMLKQFDAANETFAQIIALTEKNQDIKSRASNYALLSALQWRQLGNADSADYFLEKAIALDSSNVNFVIQKGDMLCDEKKYNEAFAQYDKAVSMGRTDMDIYEIRTSARMKMLQEKYQTTNAGELKNKMTPEEKNLLCADMQKAISLGLKDMKQDMFATLVCK